MKRLKEIPSSVLTSIKNEHDRELRKVFTEYEWYCDLPVRPVRMKILRGRTAELEQTIVPATSIYIRPKGFLDEEHLNRDAITYSIRGMKIPFPYGHIYQGSGHVCLGSIFVPSKVSKYSPQQPLETLFLHNDRNLNHGNASLTLSEETIQGVYGMLQKYGINVSEEVQESLRPNWNVLKDDGVWALGADVYRQVYWQGANVLDAIKIMEEVYGIIFEREN